MNRIGERIVGWVSMAGMFLAAALLLAGIVWIVVWYFFPANSRATGWGGTATVTVPAGEKFVNVTWKDANLWIVTRKAEPGEKPQVYHFREKSVYGVMEGNVVIQEQELGE
jgi:hypothetical protein